MAYRPNDLDVEKMSKAFAELQLPNFPDISRCLYIGRHCTFPHVVEVVPIYPKTVADSHAALDLFMWSVGLSQYSDGYVNLECDRVSLNFSQLGKDYRLDVDFVVIYYDQEETDRSLMLQYSNRALTGMIDLKYMSWSGDMFVVKVDAASGAVLDVDENDIPDISELLEHALVSGIIA